MPRTSPVQRETADGVPEPLRGISVGDFSGEAASSPGMSKVLGALQKYGKWSTGEYCKLVFQKDSIFIPK